MGCDIHLYVERREGDRWVSCDTWEKDEYEPHALTVPYGKHLFDTRSYDTFAILADVRNGRGFAGCETGAGFVPISEPKGLPSDMSPELTVEAGGCDHTPSWLTVKELMDYDWTQATTKTGLVNGPQYERWESFQKRKGDGPDEWVGDVMGGGVKHISEDEMLTLIKAIREKHEDWQSRDAILKDRLGSTYCRITWPIPYYRAAKKFLSETLPRLWRLGSPENVRIVFWFDS